jgi:leader peptidase (prepilin peptidase)/N-methyltransferase
VDLLTQLGASPLLQFTTAVVFGLVLGSFLNVVIHRLPRRMEAEWRAQCAELMEVADDSPETGATGIVWPPSACPHCESKLRAIDNIPVLSYLWLGGRCRNCRHPISPRYPIIETITAALFALVVWQIGWQPAALAAVVFTAILIALTAIDLEHMLLPDDLTLALLWLGLLVAVSGLGPSPSDAVIGAAAGYLSLWGVYQVFRLATGKEGMGYGDFKLLAALGAWLGWQYLPVVILLSAGVGAVVGVTMIALLGHERGQAIPFGPYLAAAGWIALLWGDAIITGYLQLAGIQG